MSASRRGRCSAVAAVLLVATAGCGVRTQAQPEVVPVGDPRGARAVPGTAAVEAREVVRVYVSDGTQLVPRAVRAPADTPVAALATLLATEPPGGGLTTAIPRGTQLRGLALRDGVLAVDLSAEFAAAAGRAQLLAVAQIVYTATEYPQVRGVALRIGGRPLHVPTGTGMVAPQVVTRDDYRLVAPLS